MKIVIDHLNKKIKRKEILKDINCTLENNIYGLMGPNGSGKTTLIRCILELLTTKKSMIKLYNQANQINISDIQIGYLPQIFDAFKELTVKEQLEYFLTLKNIPQSLHQEEIERVLKLTHLESQKDKRCGYLSGGMVRRLGIAQALLGNPQLIIFDEPTVGLDPDERMNFKRILKSVHLNIPIILSTHIIEDINSLCTHAIFIKEGTIKETGQINEMLKNLEGRVYDIPTSEEENMIGKKITRQISENELRVICNDIVDNNFVKVKPNLEDLYQYIIHGDELEE